MTIPSSTEPHRYRLTVPVEQRGEVADWFDEHASPTTASLNRYLITRGEVAFRPGDEDQLAVRFRLSWDSADHEAPAAPKAALPTFGGTKPRLTIYNRNEVSFLASRSWCRATKNADIARLKEAKAQLSLPLVDQAADELADVLGRFLGKSLPSVCVTTVPPGHSKRSDNFAVRLAQGVASRLSVPFYRVFEDRFVSGASHPKEFRKLPPLVMIERPAESVVLVVDDVATSGLHIEESVNRLRDEGFVTWAAVWISGAVE